MESQENLDKIAATMEYIAKQIRGNVGNPGDWAISLRNITLYLDKAQRDRLAILAMGDRAN